jgi:hypothetical protein
MLITEGKNVGDLVKNEFSQDYNYAKNKLQAAVSVAINTNCVGFPVINTPGTSAIIQTAAQVAAFTGTSSCGVVADDTPAVEAFSATPSVSQYRVAVRGPMVVKRDGLRTTDPAGASYDMAKFIAALLVAGVVVVDATGLSVTT